MSYKIGLVLLGKKGLKVLEEVSKTHSDSIEIVVIGTDKKIKNDYSLEIISLCNSKGIKHKITNSANRLLEIHKPNWWFVIGWRWLLPVRKNIIILHDSILPKYRGFSPLVNMLINGEKDLGVSALKISEFYDEGEIITQSVTSIEYPIKISEAIEIISDLYIETVKDIIDSIHSGIEIKSYPQNHQKATYSLWRNEEDYFLNFNYDAGRIERTVNALGFPFHGAKCRIGDSIYTVKEVEAIEDVIIEDRVSSIGKVIRIVNGRPVIICGQGLLLIKEIQDKNEQSLIPFKNFRSKFF